MKTDTPTWAEGEMAARLKVGKAERKWRRNRRRRDSNWANGFDSYCNDPLTHNFVNPARCGTTVVQAWIVR